MALLSRNPKAQSARPMAPKVRALTCVWLVLFALLFADRPVGPAQTATTREYQVKAVFLFNFAQFVEWPASTFPDRDTPLVIGVLGRDPFGVYLEETVRGEIVKSRQLITQRYSHVEDVRNCQVLFISRSESEKLDQIISRLKDRKILTVSDDAGHSGHGVIIRFVTQNNRIKLRINLEAAKAANLTISSKLLRLAEIDS